MGLAMRDAVLADLARVPGVELSCAVCDRPGVTLPEGVRAVRPEPGEPAVGFVQRVSREHELAWIVAPESDGVLAQMHEAVGAARWLGCSAAAICVASSKHATLTSLAARGVTTPLALEPGHRGRWIVKPDDGAGAVRTQVHADRASALEDQRERAHAGQPATVEAFIEGEALSIAMLAGPGFVQPLAFNRQHIHVDPHGALTYRGVQVNAIDARSDPRAVPLHTTALDVARALPGLRGFVGVDLVWHPERGPVVIEVNPRVTCAYVGLSAALGRNLADEIVLLHDLHDAQQVAHG